MNDIRIVFSDVDGTLLNSHQQITPATLQTLKRLEANNIPFVIISARSPSGIEPIVKEYELTCSIVSYSGSLILDETRRVVYHRGMSRADAAAILRFAEQQQLNMTWCVYSFDEWITPDRTDPRIVREETIVKATARQGGIDDVTADEVHKLLFICDPACTNSIEAALKVQFPQYSIVKSSKILLEIMPGGTTKAAAVQTLCSLWDLSPSDAAAFGDNYNDVEMLELVGHGWLMSNAPEPLKARLPHHTADHDHDGIAAVLDRLLT